MAVYYERGTPVEQEEIEEDADEAIRAPQGSSRL
jgi:hypothetical protein